ncbi:hypothetical protein OAG71_01640 [bacterium]|nr:hypothetical protein [bacterium]
MQRPLLQRNLLRRALRRHQIKSNKKQRISIREALNEGAIFEMLYEQSMFSAMNDTTTNGQFTVSIAVDGSAIADNLLSLFQWFIDHGPELIAIIELIVGLFGSEASDTVAVPSVSNL